LTRKLHLIGVVIEIAPLLMSSCGKYEKRERKNVNDIGKKRKEKGDNFLS
jgi:hypothetical protein